MKRTASSSNHEPFRRGAGYLHFAGLLQIIAGTLSLAFSALGSSVAMAFGVENLFDPRAAADRFAGDGVAGLGNLVAEFAAFQASYGWIFGLLLVVAGICTMRLRARRFIWTSTLVNLANFPHGTTVALLTWHGLTRPGVARAFDAASSDGADEGVPRSVHSPRQDAG